MLDLEVTYPKGVELELIWKRHLEGKLQQIDQQLLRTPKQKRPRGRFWKSRGISLPYPIRWTGWTSLASLPACFLPTFTQDLGWHRKLRSGISLCAISVEALDCPG